MVRIYLNGTGSSDWPSSGCGSAATGASGQTLTLSSTQTIAAASSWPTNRIVFATTNMDTKTWIELAFFMTDGSTRRVRFLPATPIASSANFTVKSIGEVRQGVFPFSVWRRIQTEYKLNTSASLQDIGNITTDTTLLVPTAVAAADERPGYRELSQRTP